jgi:ribosomal protein L37AE/L43A
MQAKARVKPGTRVLLVCELCGAQVRRRYRFFPAGAEQLVWGCSACERKAMAARGYRPLTEFEYGLLVAGMSGVGV